MVFPTTLAEIRRRVLAAGIEPGRCPDCGVNVLHGHRQQCPRMNAWRVAISAQMEIARERLRDYDAAHEQDAPLTWLEASHHLGALAEALRVLTHEISRHGGAE